MHQISNNNVPGSRNWLRIASIAGGTHWPPPTQQNVTCPCDQVTCHSNSPPPGPARVYNGSPAAVSAGDRRAPAVIDSLLERWSQWPHFRPVPAASDGCARDRRQPDRPIIQRHRYRRALPPNADPGLRGDRWSGIFRYLCVTDEDCWWESGYSMEFLAGCAPVLQIQLLCFQADLK